MLIVQAALAVLLGSPKIVCRLRTRRVECSKLGKTQLIQDAGRGMVRNTGFYGQTCLGQISSGTFGSYFSWCHS